MLGRGTSNVRKESARILHVFAAVHSSVYMRCDMCPCIWECVSVCILYVLSVCVCVCVCMHVCVCVFVCVYVCVHASLCMSVLNQLLYSSTPPCGHPWNADIHCNLDAAYDFEHILHILMYISNPWNADTLLLHNADSKYGSNNTVPIVINLSRWTELSFLLCMRPCGQKRFGKKEDSRSFVIYRWCTRC